jgi:hypothetical protein
MHVTLEPTYKVMLSRRELRLIGLALAGKLDGRDREEAACLNASIMEAVRAVVEEHAAVIASAEEKARDGAL